jgi:phage terminase large subunit
MITNQTIIQYTPVFEANKAAYDSGLYRFIGNEGSSRSSKSYSLAQLMNVIAMQQHKEITITSPTLPHLKRGAMKDVLDVMKSWGTYREKNHNKTDNIIHFPKTESYIEFFGAEQTDKLQGPGRDILWLNEMPLISQQSYIQLAIRTKETIFGDWNPADEYSYVYPIADDPANKKIHSTYLNNLHFLPKFQVQEIENLKDIDENLWNVFGLGLRGTSTETIYTHWKEIDHFPECDQVCYGLDFGFNHPNVLIRIGLKDDVLYWDEMLYESKMTTDDLAYAIKTLGLDGTCEIFADSARPDTIEELNRAGLWVQEANKSVWDGIQFVKGKKLYITKNSINLLKEIKSYKWMVDKNGIVTEKPVKFKDDGMDAGRYGSFTKFSQPLIQYAGATY